MVEAMSNVQIAYFCPGCQNIDVVIHRPVIIDPAKTNGGATYECPACGSAGDASELIGALNPENQDFWNEERIGNVMLRAGAKLAAAPMLQVMELIGIAPRISFAGENPESRKEMLQEIMDVRQAIVKDVIAAFVEAAFESAARHAGPFFEKHNMETQAKALKDGASNG